MCQALRPLFYHLAKVVEVACCDDAGSREMGKDFKRCCSKRSLLGKLWWEQKAKVIAKMHTEQD